MEWKDKVNKIIAKLQVEATESEQQNKIEIKKNFTNKDIKIDKQYWNGYLDALDNIKKSIKRTT